MKATLLKLRLHLKTYSYWLVLLLNLAALILTPEAAWAKQVQDSTVQVSSLEIDLWPEYDRPSILVIYRITLDASTSLPADISLRLPISAEINAVAVKDIDGQLLNVNFDQETGGPWQVLRVQIALRELQIEYYDPNLQKNGAQRSFVYSWPGDYAVKQASVQFQQPVDASNSSITPGPVTTQTLGGEMVYYNKDVGALQAGQGFQLEINYQKSSDRLSAASMPVEPSAPLPNQNSLSENFNGYLPWGMAFLGLLLIGGGIYWYWRSSYQQADSLRHRSRGQRAKARHTSETMSSASDPIYCSQCGRRAAVGDRFCRSCGSRLRIE